MIGQSCNLKTDKQKNIEDNDIAETIFPIGELGPSKNFTERPIILAWSQMTLSTTHL